LGYPPILNQGALAIIKQNEMDLVASTPYVKKLVNLAFDYYDWK